MSWLQAVLLGLLQGLTEFLPVSSTAHMDVIPQLFGQNDPGAAFSAVCQLGPIVAIIAYFRKDLLRYVQGILRTKTPANLTREDVDARLGWYTLIASIPIVIAGVALEKYVDTHFRRLDVVAVALIVLALVLAWAERVGKRAVTLERMTFKQSFVIGMAQILGLVPGASRSGTTITAGLLQGLDRESAARFSFLLSIPAITGAGLYKLVKVIKSHDAALHDDKAKYLLAAVVAGLFAYGVVRWFMGYMKEHNTGIFIAYRIVFGLAILGLFHSGQLKEHKVEEPKSAALSTHAVGWNAPLSAPVKPGVSYLPRRRAAIPPNASSPAVSSAAAPGSGTVVKALPNAAICETA